MQQTKPLHIGGLPLALTCYSNGCISLQPLGSFETIIEQTPLGVCIISVEDMLLYGEQIVYNNYYEISHEPILKQWLVNQNI
jgi:hypothetical protein